MTEPEVHADHEGSDLPTPDECLDDIVEEWGLQSFPASDAPANW